MNKAKAIETILHLHDFLTNISKGIALGGKVEVVEIAIRVEEGGFVFASLQTDWQIVKTENIVYHKSESTCYQSIFNARKKIQVVLKNTTAVCFAGKRRNTANP
jgi:hypothetical protein